MKRSKGPLNSFHVPSVNRTDQTVIALFSKVSAENPGAIAVIHRETSLTYGELDYESNRLACTLIDNGVKAEVIVPVFMEPGLGIIVAILAIMKAGGAYTPVEPEYPVDRVAYILEDTSCKVVLASKKTRGKLPSNSAYNTILLEDFRPLFEANSFASRATLPNPEDPAYVMYTSGSTGKPKGVVVEHSQIYTYTLDAYHNLELEECRSYATLGTFSADAGLTAVFAALCFGKSLCIADMNYFSDFDSLVHYFSTNPVDCYKITPSLVEFFLQHKHVHKILPAKRLILGGEACSKKLVQRLLNILPKGCVLFNHYGPTEATVGVITYKFPTDSESLPDVVPLGKPFIHVDCYVLDEKMVRVTAGTIGELCLAGPLLARGYLNNPDLTDQKFINCVLDGKNKRIYKTGDLVRVLSCGNIEYLGRSDDQVKIHGYRVELKEVENAVLNTGMVKQCLIMAREDHSGIKYLAGYVISTDSFDKHSMLEAIKNKLPGYMIPRKWVELEAWPLTFNNKIDKKALPNPNQSKPTHALPIPEIDEWLLELWRRLLDLDEFNTEDHFFDLGGDSMLLIKLRFDIYDRLRIRIEIEELLNNLTIGRLSQLIRKKKESVPSTNEEHKEFDALEASTTQKNLFLQNRLNPSEAFPHSSLTFEIVGSFDEGRLERAFLQVILANESLRTAYSFLKGRLYKKIINEVSFNLEYHSTNSTNIDEEIDKLTQPFNFKNVPLIRVFIIKLGDSRQYLTIDLPHINSDGESMKLIVRDVEAVYNNPKIRLKPLQFTDFQKRVHAYSNSAQFQEDKAYWQHKLSGEIEALPFRKENTRDNLSRFAGECVVSQLTFPTLAEINICCRKKHLTRFQMMLIAYFLLVYKITSARVIVVMVPVHNRNELGSEDIVGLLTNVILIKLNIERNSTIAEFVTACRDTILEAMAHQKYPLEEILHFWNRRGRDTKQLMSSFFGYHQNKEEYVFGKATLKMHIPLKSKEYLPLSAAVFETQSNLTLKLSCTIGTFSQKQLKILSLQYFEILEKIVKSDVHSLIETII